MDHVSANKTLPVFERENISGARVFDGEDQGLGNRVKMQQLQQKDWCEQQILEKQRKLQRLKEENQNIDAEALRNYQILKETQTEHNRQRTSNEIDTQNINKLLHQDKVERDIQMHQTWSELEARELEYTNNHDFMTENPQTEVSMLAPHRVKPYHFKGFNQSQIDQVNLERQQQVREAQMMKKQKEDEDKLYALQQEQLRRQQVLEDRKMKKTLRNVMEDTKMVQTSQAQDSKLKWIDPYHEKDMEPKHVGNLKL